MTLERTSTNLKTREPSRSEEPAIFGLRYLEEEAAEVHDVVGCMMNVRTAVGTATTGTGCDDHDGPIYLA
jgi:hypothetical protein